MKITEEQVKALYQKTIAKVKAENPNDIFPEDEKYDEQGEDTKKMFRYLAQSAYELFSIRIEPPYRILRTAIVSELDKYGVSVKMIDAVENGTSLIVRVWSDLDLFSADVRKSFNEALRTSTLRSILDERTRMVIYTREEETRREITLSWLIIELTENGMLRVTYTEPQLGIESREAVKQQVEII